MFSYNCGSRGGIALLVGATLMGLLTCPVGAQTKTYTVGPPINAFFAKPSANDEFADASHSIGNIILSVYADDYDAVTYTSADGTVTFTNKQRTQNTDLWVVDWLVVGGDRDGYLEGGPGRSAAYYPPPLDLNESSRSVTIRCTVRDNNQTEGRKDSDKVIERTFTIVKKPTIANLVVQPVNASGNPLPISTPITSGWDPGDKVFLRFSFDTRQQGWSLADADVQWTTPWGSGTGQTFITPNKIPRWEAHRRFNFSVTATFRAGESLVSSDTKSGERILAFFKTVWDEFYDISRGESREGTFNPPNWFDTHFGNHWGNVVPRFNETDPNLNGSYVVYYTPRFSDAPPTMYAYTDWNGLYAPPGHQFEEAYRGRIYIFAQIMEFHDQNPASTRYGVAAGGIDAVAVTIAHEFAHRDLWLAAGNWGGFSDAHIRPDGQNWLPGDRLRGYDNDGDLVKNQYEKDHKDDFHFDYENEYSIQRWWTGNKSASDVYDSEMYPQLWGEWLVQIVNSLDPLDWSAGGRQDY